MESCLALWLREQGVCGVFHRMWPRWIKWEAAFIWRLRREIWGAMFSSGMGTQHARFCWFEVGVHCIASAAPCLAIRQLLHPGAKDIPSLSMGAVL